MMRQMALREPLSSVASKVLGRPGNVGDKKSREKANTDAKVCRRISRFRYSSVLLSMLSKMNNKLTACPMKRNQSVLRARLGKLLEIKSAAAVSAITPIESP